MFRSRSLIIGFAALAFHSPGFAAALDVSGSISAELRWFASKPQFPGQLSHLQPSLIFEPEFRWSLENGDQVTISPYGQLDGQDDERSHLDLREAYWRHFGETWDVLIGINKVYWGVTESRHLVDVINQVDGVVDTDEEDRLGQAMINFSTQRDWGRLDLYVLPGFRERTFAGTEGRPRFALTIDTDNPVYESGTEENHVDYAARYSHYLGDWDIGAHFFYGTGREPRFSLSSNGQQLIPNYDLVTQIGVDLQYTREAWLWKFEALIREGQGKTFAAMVGGFEYTLYQIRESAADLGLLVEYLRDDRDRDPTVAPATVFQNDLFLGARLALNDIQNTSVLAGAIVDLDNQSSLVLIEAERRLGNRWSIDVEARLFLNADDDPLLNNFREDDFINLTLGRHF